MALDEAGRKDIESVKEAVKGPVALVFSNENAFDLFREIKSTKVKAAAREGDVADKDIVISKGSTELPPGPAISTLQKAGIKAQVQGGKIAVMNDTSILHAGDTVTANIVAVLNLLNIMPNEKSLNVSTVWEDGVLYGSDVLDIDVEAFAENVQKGIFRGISLSVACGYLTRESAPIAIQKAFMEGLSVSLEADFLTRDTASFIIGKAVRAANAVQEKMPETAEEKKGEGKEVPGEEENEGGKKAE